MVGERSQASSLITVGCITRETRAKDYRDWFCCDAAQHAVPGWGGATGGPTHGWNSILHRHPGSPGGRQRRHAHWCRLGPLRRPAAAVADRLRPAAERGGHFHIAGRTALNILAETNRLAGGRPALACAAAAAAALGALAFVNHAAARRAERRHPPRG